MYRRLLLFCLFLLSILPISAQSSTLNLALVLEGPANLIEGQRFYLSYRVKNDDADAQGVTVIHSLPAELGFVAGEGCSFLDSSLICPLGHMGSGEEKTQIVLLELLESLDSLSLNAFVSSSSLEAELADNFASLSISMLEALPTELRLSSSLEMLNLVLGQEQNWEFEIQNLGAEQVRGLHLEISLSAALSIPSLPGACGLQAAIVHCYWDLLDAGASLSLSLSLRAESLLAAGSIQARLWSSAEESEEGDNLVERDLEIVEAPGESADLHLHLDAGDGLTTVGQIIQIAIRIENSGPRAVNNAQLSLQIPNGLAFMALATQTCSYLGVDWHCAIGALNVGQAASYNLRLQVLDTSTALSLGAELSSERLDALPLNNHVSLILSPPIVLNPSGMPTTLSATGLAAIAANTIAATNRPQAIVTLSPSASSSQGAANAPSDQYGWRRFESADFIQMTGIWALRQSQNASEGAYHESRDAQARLRYPFSGDGFRLGYRSTVNGAPFEIYLDGELIATYQTDYAFFSASTDEPRQSYLSEAVFLIPGYHLLDIVSLADGEGSFGVNIDFIEIFTGPPIPEAASTAAASSGEEPVVSFSPLRLAATPPATVPADFEQIVHLHIRIGIDENRNGIQDANEGIEGLSIRVLDAADNSLLASLQTDKAGQAQQDLLTDSDLMLLLPLLGESRYFSLERGERSSDLNWELLLEAIQLPGLIP